MTRMTPFAFVAILCALLFAGCTTTSQEFNATPTYVAYPMDLPKDKALKAMAQTFLGRQWSITGKTEDSVTGSIQHKGYDTQVVMQIQGDKVVFTVQSTRQTYVKGKRDPLKDAVPMGWIEYLQKDLRKNLQLAQF